MDLFHAVSSTKNKLQNLSIEEFNILADLVLANNSWFTYESLKLSLEGIILLLDEYKIKEICQQYGLPVQHPKKIGLILAGNIPAVGFHDVMSVLLSGHKAIIKLSSTDSVLIPWLLNIMIEAVPEIKERLVWSDSMKDIDALIVTGNDQTAKHFAFYFKHIPTIIRKNRTSIAILVGDETEVELKELGKDVFSYYGLGCRNVTYLLVPETYDLTQLLDQWNSYFYVINNSKYSHNYDYNKSIFLINKEDHMDNGFLLLRPSERIQSALSVINYFKYDSEESMKRFVLNNSKEIQCIVSKKQFDEFQTVAIGQAQCPNIYDFADGVNTFEFLKKINE
jgi:hypothetical protein